MQNNSKYIDIWILDEFCSYLKDHEGYKRELWHMEEAD